MHKELIRNRYLLLKEIFSNETATIFRAWDYNLEKMIAVKKIHPFITTSEEVSHSLYQQIIKSSRLKHKNILPVYDFFKSVDNICYIMMEYAHGKDLSTLLKKCKEIETLLPYELTLKIIYEITQALCYAHEFKDKNINSFNGVFHFNVSPANIIIYKDASVKLTDFGISRILLHSHRSPIKGKHKEKCNYMSPEEIENKHIDGRADLFSLGILFYELLTGFNPFKGKDEYQTKENILKIEPDISKIPSNLQLFIGKLIAKDSAKRYQVAKEFLLEYSAFMSSIKFGKRQDDLLRFIVKLFPDFQSSDETEKITSKEMVSKINITEEFEMGKAPMFVTNFEDSSDKSEIAEVKQDRFKNRGVEKTVSAQQKKTVPDKPKVKISEIINKKIAALKLKFKFKIKIAPPALPKIKIKINPKVLFKSVIITLFLVFMLFIDIPHGVTPFGKFIKRTFLPIDIYIDTIPSGANVKMFNLKNEDIIIAKNIKNITPFKISDVDAGKYRLVLSKEGFSEVEREIVINRKKIRAKSGTVEIIIPFEIKLEIESIPESADIYINSEKKSFVTPIIMSLEAKMYNIKLAKEGFEPIECSMDLFYEKNNIDVNYWKLETKGQGEKKSYKLMGILEKEVSIETNPTGAKLFIAETGQFIGNTPLNIKLKAGEYRFNITKEGYKSVERKIEIKSKDDKKFVINLRKLGVKLEINSNPDGAAITINGEKINQKTPAVLDLETKVYTIRLLKDNFSSIRCNLDFSEGKHNFDKSYWNFEVIKQDEEKSYKLFGTLEKEISLNTNPSSAKVYFADSDEYIGTTPVKVKLKTGTHRIRISKTKYETLNTNIEINNKTENSILLNLKLTSSKPIVVKNKVEIDSKPKGAIIYINGKNSGLITPTSILLEQKQYAIKLSKENFMDIGSNKVDDTSVDKGRCNIDLSESKHNLDRNLWSMEVSDSGKEKNYKLLGILEKEISIETKPSDAKIYFADNDQYVGNSPVKIKLKAGTYRLQIIKAKYKPILTNINTEGVNSNFVFELKSF